MMRGEAALIALLVTITVILVLHPIAHRIGLVDRPGGRKQHTGFVPVTGGIAMFLGIAAAVPVVEPPITSALVFLLAGALLVVVGVIDDHRGVSPRVRLLAQAIAALLITLGGGVMTSTLGDIAFIGDLALGHFAVPFTVLVVMTLINAFNFLDGMDALAGGIALTSVIGFICTAMLFGSDAGLSLALCAMAAVLAFLLFNFPSAVTRRVRTFMGDSGATLLGLVIAWIGLRLAGDPQPVISPVASLYIVAVPIFDFFISFWRRMRRGQSPMASDREHLHYVLQDAGFSDREVLFIMIGVSVIIAAGGIGAHYLGVSDGVLFVVIVLLCFAQAYLMRRAAALARWLGGTRGPTVGVPD